MQSVNLSSTVSSAAMPDHSLGESPEMPTVLENPGREKSLFLTSLLLTSSLVTFALTSVPQMFSLSGLPAFLQQSIPAKPASLNMLSQAAHPPTWAGRPASSPATAVSEITASKITAVPGKSTIVVQGTPSPLTLSLPATSESYVVYVLVQPKSAVAVSSVASQPQ